MKKENVFVKINNKKEAKNAKRILEALGENTRENYMPFLAHHVNLWFSKHNYEWTVGVSCGRTEVTLKELIEIIVSEKPKTEDRCRANFLIKSEDGVDLYHNDDVCWVIKTYDKWQYEYNLRICDTNASLCLKNPETYRLFHSKENALKWIEEQNKPKELEVGKWYKHKDGSLVFNIGTLGNHGYGFDSCNVFGHSAGWTFYSHPHNWTLATEQEVFEALRAEAVKRYIGKTPKCVHGCREIKHTNDFEFNWDGECLRSSKTGVGANCLFHEGKWAEIIEEVKQPEFITVSPNAQYPVEVYNDKIRIKCNGSENHSDNLIIRADELEQIYQAYKSLQTK